MRKLGCCVVEFVFVKIWSVSNNVGILCCSYRIFQLQRALQATTWAHVLPSQARVKLYSLAFPRPDVETVLQFHSFQPVEPLL